MKLGIISFTNNGLELSKRVAESLTENTGITTAVYTKCSLVKTHDTKIKAVHVEKSIADWTKEQMQEKMPYFLSEPVELQSEPLPRILPTNSTIVRYLY